MGKLIINGEIKDQIESTLINGDIKLTWYQKEILMRFLVNPELIKIETEFPVVADIVKQLRGIKDTTEPKLIGKINNVGKLKDLEKKKIGRPTDERKDVDIKARVSKRYKNKLKEFCKENNIKNVSVLTINALNKYMEDINNAKK